MSLPFLYVRPPPGPLSIVPSLTKRNGELTLPRLPVLGFASLRGAAPSGTGSVIDNRSALLTTSARAAFLHALRVLGVMKGDRVLVPTYHCPTMISPVIRLGAIPVYYPISSAGLPMTSFLDAIETNGVKAMLTAHFFGLPLPLEGIRRFCDARHIALIEDCAHAFFGQVAGQTVGGVGDVALASLPKFFPVAEGGCLVGPPELLARIDLAPAPAVSELRCLADVIEIGARFGRFGVVNGPLRAAFSAKDRLRGRTRAKGPSELIEAYGNPAEEHDPWLENAMVERRMTRATEWLMHSVDRGRIVEARRRNYALLSALLSGLRDARPLFPDLAAGAVPYVFPLEVDSPDPLYREIRAAGIPVFRWDRLWPGTPSLDGDVGVEWSHRVFQIGCHQDLSESDIHAIATVLKELLSRKRR